MIDFLKLTENQRRGLLNAIDYTRGIPEKAVEKDWWVTLTLKALFSGRYKNELLFKGGTSLSKGWNLIQRFSEDIDIALDPRAFGEKYIENPSKNYVKNLRRKGSIFTSNALKNDLIARFEAMGIPEGTLEVIAAPIHPSRPDTDPQTLYVRYQSLFGKSTYLADEVKIEVSTRYMKEPSSPVFIQSMLHEFKYNPESYKETPFEVIATEPHRTFLEKAFLLHEVFLRPERTKAGNDRMSRHLYDLVKMTDAGVNIKALESMDLYRTIVNHRKHYSMLPWMGDYSSLDRDKISFSVPEDLQEVFEKDYKSMREEMIYEDAPSFEELNTKINKLVSSFRTGDY